MADFSKNNTTRAPFGRNEFRRSTRAEKINSFTCGKASVPAITIDGDSQKVLQPGTVMAKVTSGADIGKIGVFQAGVTDGRQTAANIVGIDVTFLPWQLLERDVEVGVEYDGAVVQAWCIEYDAGGLPIPLSNATRDAMLALPNLAFIFH